MLFVVSVSQKFRISLAVWFLIRVSHNVVKMSTLQSSNGLPKAERSASGMACSCGQQICTGLSHYSPYGPLSISYHDNQLLLDQVIQERGQDGSHMSYILALESYTIAFLVTSVGRDYVRARMPEGINLWDYIGRRPTTIYKDDLVPSYLCFFPLKLIIPFPLKSILDLMGQSCFSIVASKGWQWVLFLGSFRSVECHLQSYFQSTPIQTI